MASFYGTYTEDDVVWSDTGKLAANMWLFYIRGKNENSAQTEKNHGSYSGPPKP